MKRGVHAPTYRSWQMMKNRCLNPQAADFRHYGGKGIGVPNEWLTFEGFVSSMGLRPDGTTLDRVDGTKSYSKLNCRWATRQTQAQNRDYTLNLTFCGETKKTWEWAEELGLALSSFHHRLWRYRCGDLTAEHLFKKNPRKEYV